MRILTGGEEFSDVLFTVSVPLYNASILNIMDDSFMYSNYKWRDVLHNHNNPELFFMVRGRCSLKTESQVFDFAENDIFAVPAFLYHIIINQSDDLQLHPLRFFLSQRADSAPGALYDAYSVLSAFMQEGAGVTVLRDCARVVEQVRKIRSELYWQLPEYRESVTARFQLLYIELIRMLKEEVVPLDTPGGDRFNVDPSHLAAAGRAELDIAIIEHYFNHRQYAEPNIAGLAGMLNLSVSYTHKLIRQLYGVSFHQKLTKTRILAAQRLLAETDYSQERIAELVGYQSYNGFLTAFKRQTGMTPLVYRNKLTL